MKPIALDAMGGDFAPRETVAGALLAAEAGVPVVLVGDEARLKAELGALGSELPIVHAPEVVAMDEDATLVRRKKGASINVAVRLVKEGEAAAAVSMGHTGASLAAALFILGREKGIERPALLAELPADTPSGRVHVIDAGANADVRPGHLAGFARLGQRWARHRGVEQPRIGLLSIGEEAKKGNQLVKAAWPLMEKVEGFIGNVEGRDILAGKADVVVTDGFTGNVVLKLVEGEARVLMGWVKAALTSSTRAKVGALLARDALRALACRLDPAEYGAMPLLGLNGPVFVGHGASDRRAVKNALIRARDWARALG